MSKVSDILLVRYNYVFLCCGFDNYCSFYLLDHSGERNKYSMIQYWFDGPPVEVKPKPHGNSHSSTPFFRTADSAKQKHKEIASTSRPTEALYKATQECGGELEATGMQKLPRNMQQMKNYCRTGHSKDQNILYSVMLQCKLTDGTSDAFVRDVKAAPHPQCVMAFDWQVNDLVRFLTDDRKFSVFTADTTYNVGEFYVTPTTYKHLMLVDITSKKNPTMAGPVLVHQRKNFATFNYFASTLVSFNKKLHGLLAFGTDGDEALIEAFSHNFPFAIQLRCFLHMKRNIQSKLGERGLLSSVSEEFLSNIFGKHVCSRYEEGLVDSVSSVDFETRLQNCKDVWNAREVNYLHLGQASFFDYFVQQYSKVFENTMLKSTRTAAGLGYPPEIFTTNSSESLNATIKRKVNYKESEWPEFNEYMRQLSYVSKRKGGIPKRKRSRVFTATDVVVSRATTMQAHGVSSAFNTQSGATTVSFPTEQRLNSGFATMQAPEVSSVFNTQSGATTVSFPTEQRLNSGFATMQAPEVSSVFNTHSGATTVSFPTEQRLNSGFATMQAPEVSSVFNTQSGATTESFPTELCLSSGLSRPNTTTTASVSVQVGNNFSSFSNSQVQPLIVNASLGPLVQSQSLVDSVSSSVMAPPSPVPPNTNPFYMRFIEGNICMCQGCKSFLKCANGSLPAPPFDLCCARVEKRSFRDSNGILRTPNKEQPSHYHINLLCIRAASPSFVPSSIFIPPDVMPKLSAVHKEYFRLVFHVSF